MMAGRRYAVGIFIILCLLFSGSTVKAESVEELMDEMDFSEISDFLEEKEEVPVTFEEILKQLIGGGEVPYEKIGAYIKDRILWGLEEQKDLVVKLLVVALAFSLLKNYAKSFANSYVSEICFFLCYCFVMVVLLQSFSDMNETIENTTDDMVVFIKTWIPTYCMTISMSLNLNSAAATYSMIFVAIYLVEWLMHYILIPLVQIYVMMEFLNHLLDEPRFRKLSDFVAGAVRVLLKATVSFVFGINIIQGMIAPAMDRLAGNTVVKTIQMVPGIGNVMSGMGQMFLSSSLVIKNSMGAAALLILVLLCVMPFLKMALLAVLYKFLAAILEPLADKRISGGMNGIANGGVLYLKILCTCLMMFFLTIALGSAAIGTGG